MSYGGIGIDKIDGTYSRSWDDRVKKSDFLKFERILYSLLLMAVCLINIHYTIYIDIHII